MKKLCPWILFNIIFWAVILVVQEVNAAELQAQTSELTNEELLARSETWKTIVFSWWAEVWAIVSTIINFVLLTRKGQDLANKANPLIKTP